MGSQCVGVVKIPGACFSSGDSEFEKQTLACCFTEMLLQDISCSFCVLAVATVCLFLQHIFKQKRGRCSSAIDGLSLLDLDFLVCEVLEKCEDV